MNIFQKIKNEVDFIEAMTFYCGPLKEIGEGTWTTEEDECPIHGGHGCFRMKVDGVNSLVNCFGNCDHDDWPVDLIEFVRIKEGLETVGESARLIAKDFNVKQDVESTTSKILRLSQQYYVDQLTLSTKKEKSLGFKPPMAFQLENRFHKEDFILDLGVGWSDGGLLEHLEDDFTIDELLSSGMILNTKGRIHDMVPKNSFAYPHYWNGRLSRFTFKNMGKAVYQMKKECWLNGIEFYKIGSGSPVAVVEGENDAISLLEDGWEGTVLCTIGALSKAQVDWMISHPDEYHTFFDGDNAGLKYMKMLWKAYTLGKIPRLTQWTLPEGMDIDTFLIESELSDLREMPPPDREEFISVKEKAKINVVEEAGCYKAISFNKEGDQEIHVPISDFVIRLLYVKVQGEERSRVVRIVRNDGRKSRPVLVNSEAKVSLRHWKILVANAVDASFTGNEIDLASMWSYVYSHQREAVVDVPTYVGDMEDGKGWLFGNQYISKDADITADDDSIMWFDNKKTSGIAPKSLMSNQATTDIPLVWQGDDTEDFVKDLVYNLNEILKDPGLVLTIVGWLRSCAYSMPLFYEAKVKYFPFLLLWGRHGRGKSTLANWMLSIYDMADKGTTTVGQLRSGVGIERKLSYYRGLPYCIDELRADRQASEYSKIWRGWYNRSSRVKGTRMNEDIVQVPVNACLFFSGQDTFTDPAMRSRCIPCKFPSNAGDDKAYVWLEDEVEDFPTIGYHWIKEALNSDMMEVKDGIQEYKEQLKVLAAEGIASRSLGNYAMVGYFAKDLAAEIFPKFDFMKWMAASMKDEQVEETETDMVSQFWEGVAGLQIGDRPGINGNHISIKNGKLHVWYAEVHKLISANSKGTDSREAFSRGAVRDALHEESYYEKSATVRLGPIDTSRRCMVFDTTLSNLPQEFVSVVETTQNSF